MSIKEVETKFEGANYGEFKRNVADVVCESNENDGVGRWIEENLL